MLDCCTPATLMMEAKTNGREATSAVTRDANAWLLITATQTGKSGEERGDRRLLSKWIRKKDVPREFEQAKQD
jgi:hypothetical protein